MRRPRCLLSDWGEAPRKKIRANIPKILDYYYRQFVYVTIKISLGSEKEFGNFFAFTDLNSLRRKRQKLWHCNLSIGNSESDPFHSTQIVPACRRIPLAAELGKANQTRLGMASAGFLKITFRANGYLMLILISYLYQNLIRLSPYSTKHSLPMASGFHN